MFFSVFIFKNKIWEADNYKIIYSNNNNIYSGNKYNINFNIDELDNDYSSDNVNDIEEKNNLNINR